MDSSSGRQADIEPKSIVRTALLLVYRFLVHDPIDILIASHVILLRLAANSAQDGWESSTVPYST